MVTSFVAISCPTKQLCDVNGDGSVTKPELKEALWSLGQHPSEEEMDLMFRDYDVDQTGTLDFNEFKLLMVARLTYKVGLLRFTTHFTSRPGEYSECPHDSQLSQPNSSIDSMRCGLFICIALTSFVL